MQAQSGTQVAAGHQKGVVMRRIRLLAAVATAAAAGSGSAPAWAGNPRLDGAAQVAANVIQGIGPTTSLPLGTSPGCPAEKSTTGNVQVNCVAEDGPRRRTPKA